MNNFSLNAENRLITSEDLPKHITASGMPEGQYRAVEAWSQSQLKLLPDWPELFYGYHIARLWEFKRTPDIELGLQMHAVHLEKQPLLIIPEYALTSNGQRRGKNWETWKENHPDNPGILEKDSARIKAMCAACEADPEIMQLFHADGEVEHSLFWTDEATGLDCKGRLDKIVFGKRNRVIVDLKATNIDPTNEREVSKKIYQFAYHQQAAFYSDAIELIYGERPHFVFVFVRNKPPYSARAWKLNEIDMDLGRRHNKRALEDLKCRLESDDWHGPGFGEIRSVSLPAYAYTDDPLDVSKPEPFEEFTGFSDY